VAKTTTISDLVYDARRWLASLGRVLTLSSLVGLAPVPASRPRVSRWGTYYAKGYANWMKAALALVKGDRHATPVDGPCVVLMEQVVEKPRTSKLDYPRGDVDNYAKGPLDIITKSERIWKDDTDVIGLIVFKRFASAGEKPGTHIEYVELQGAT
jgi:Holliday junction resolvase RusA-like endonuclease